MQCRGTLLCSECVLIDVDEIPNESVELCVEQCYLSETEDCCYYIILSKL